MTIITFFNPTGSSGRTTAVMAMASAILEDGRQKPAVIDLTEEAKPQGHGKPSSLTVWEEQMVGCGFGFDDFRVEEVHDFERMIRVDVYCEVGNFGYQLVDTPERPNDLVLNMVQRSDVIIVPFRNASEAASGSKWLAKGLNKKTLIYGLVTGVDTDEEYQTARAAFRGFPVLDNYLPTAPVFERQRETGHLFHVKSHEAYPENPTAEGMLVRVTNAEGCVSAKLLWDEVHSIICEATVRKSDARPAHDLCKETQ